MLVVVLLPQSIRPTGGEAMSATRKADSAIKRPFGKDSDPGRHSARPDKGRQIVARPDRAEKVAMTTRVSPWVRRRYKILAAELYKTMDEVQVVALLLFIMKFKDASQAEYQGVWEAIRKELGLGRNGTDD
jgi:hypothetical protein